MTPHPTPRLADVWDELFHACAFAAFVAEARAVGGWPQSEPTKRRANRLYEEQLARRHETVPPSGRPAARVHAPTAPAANSVEPADGVV